MLSYLGWQHDGAVGLRKEVVIMFILRELHQQINDLNVSYKRDTKETYLSLEMVFNFALSEHCDAAYTQALKFCRHHPIAKPTTQFQFSKAVAIPHKRWRLSSFNELFLIQFIPPFQKHQSKTFYAGKTKVPVADVNVPVIGGHAGVTILPLFSQATPSANLNAGVIAKEENVATNVMGNRCSLSSNNALNDHPNGQVENKFCGNASFTADTAQEQHDSWKDVSFPKPGQLSLPQQRVYEDFVRFPRQNQSGQSSHSMSASVSVQSANSGINGTLKREFV
ncbi:hypothetical protein KIW84_063713 [Lathyrus oleraceus]|uniref:Lactate/malate dehydrogenase C-terminal domain-containing protein n=1 Tax=Pisum sativum TaxID=3888 RepID=A0A9D4WA86_PEA|nr:hypothetical protein KIW84_063713 [Pisum sativum]